MSFLTMDKVSNNLMSGLFKNVSPNLIKNEHHFGAKKIPIFILYENIDSFRTKSQIISPNIS